MRNTTTRALATAGVGAAMLVGGAATAVSAHAASSTGTLKVHELGTAAHAESNDPQVCKFNFEAFMMDTGQGGTITISSQGGQDDGATVLSLTLSAADSEGYSESAYINADPGAEADGMRLADGHYKATLHNEGAADSAKTKVFKVQCETTESTPPATTESTPPATTESTPPATTESTPPATTETTPPAITETMPPSTTVATTPGGGGTTPSMVATGTGDDAIGANVPLGIGLGLAGAGLVTAGARLRSRKK